MTATKQSLPLYTLNAEASQHRDKQRWDLLLIRAFEFEESAAMSIGSDINPKKQFLN